jgi:hypothetical protein
VQDDDLQAATAHWEWAHNRMRSALNGGKAGVHDGRWDLSRTLVRTLRLSFWTLHIAIGGAMGINAASAMLVTHSCEG